MMGSYNRATLPKVRSFPYFAYYVIIIIIIIIIINYYYHLRRDAQD